MEQAAEDLTGILEAVLNGELSCGEARVLASSGQIQAFPVSEKIIPLLEHYWDDEDIRKSDLDYRRMQQDELSKLIQKLRESDFTGATTFHSSVPQRDGSPAQDTRENKSRHANSIPRRVEKSFPISDLSLLFHTRSLDRVGCASTLGHIQRMDQMKRYRLARASYWSLFIIAPSVALFFFLGASTSSAGACFGIGVVLAVIGEHGFRPWKRLWKVES